MKKIITSTVFGMVCLILTCAITMQLKLEHTAGSQSEQTKLTDKLKDQIVKLNNENDKLNDKLEKMVLDLEHIRDEAAKNDSSSVSASELIKKYTIISGETDVNGQGVIIDYTINGTAYNTDIAKDLRDIVNELKNAGAEAISINGQRISALSSIEMVKNKIELNNVQIEGPYTIKAIGDAEIIYNSLTRPGGTIELIKTNKNMKVNINIDMVKNMKITKYSEI